MELLHGAGSGLFTDFYELTMAASYHRHGMVGRATFELFVRSLPAERRFLVAAGLDPALDLLERFHFSDEDLRYLRSLPQLDADFVDSLADLRFGGDVWAVAEGEVVFAEEPLLRVTAPLPEAQLVETALLNLVMSHTMVASKAARVAIACAGRTFVDFSPRRDHGLAAALTAARASFIGGASATSFVLAGRHLGIPLSGTMAHSYVMSFDDEREAFRTFARQHPGTTLLIDTYDTVEGARRAADVALELRAAGGSVGAVRLDSGDLHALSREVRSVLDGAGLADVAIFASGDLDEHRIAALVERGAPIDGFGVGTQLGTSADAPSLGGVYKLVEDERGPQIKLAPGKVTVPGRKQVWRVGEGTPGVHDVVALDGEEVAGGRPLLHPVMEGGRRLTPPAPLDDLRARCSGAVAALPAEVRRLEPRESGGAGQAVDVRLSDRLTALVDDVRRRAGHATGASEGAR